MVDCMAEDLGTSGGGDAGGAGAGGRDAIGGRGGLRLLVTMGPTHEPIDEVRFIGNRSSGRVGAAIADAGAARGMRVTACVGPGSICPSDTRVVVERFRSAGELAVLLDRLVGGCDCLVMAAAVADYRPAGVRSGKVRRAEGERLVLELEAVPDLLAGVSRRFGGVGARPLLVGFALEPAEGLVRAARAKLERKGVDAVVANPLETMESGEISATVVWRDGREETAGRRMSKGVFGAWLVDRLEAAVAERGGGGG